jgi:hypothetical protein
MIRASLLLVFVGLSACYTPSCEMVCRHLRSCDLDPRLTQDECELACDAQAATYEDLDDDRVEALKDHRRCVSAATCDELADGACYDPSIFPY